MLRSVARACWVGLLFVLLATTASFADDGVSSQPTKPQVTFTISTDSIGLIEGTGPANKIIRVTLRDGSGFVRARAHDEIDSHGTWYVLPQVLSPINANDTITARVGDYKRSWKVPLLRGSVDRATNRLSVTTEPNQPLSIRLIPWSSKLPSVTHAGVADSHGRYSFVSGRDVRGGDVFVVDARFGFDRIVNSEAAPMVMLFRGDSLVEGFAPSAASISLTLQRHDGTVRSHVSASPLYGRLFIAMFAQRSGQTAVPRPGDVVTANIDGALHLTVPLASVRGDSVTDVIHGRCMANAPFQVQALSDFDSLRFGEAAASGITDAAGHFAVDVSDQMNLGQGDTLSVACSYPSGDQYIVRDEVK